MIWKDQYFISLKKKLLHLQLMLHIHDADGL